MAPAHGRKAEDGQGSLASLYAAGRLLGFSLLAGAALAILAGVVLLPAYAETAGALYQRDCEKMRLANMTSQRIANERLIAAVERGDEVATRRLAFSSLGVMPANEIALPPVGAPVAQGLLDLPHYPMPAPPQNWPIHASQRLQDPQARRGLLALAAGAMLTAMLCFAPPEKYRRKTPPPA